MYSINFSLSQIAFHMSIYYTVTVRHLFNVRMHKFIFQKYLFDSITAYFSDQIVEIIGRITPILWQPKAYIIRARRISADRLKIFIIFIYINYSCLSY